MHAPGVPLRKRPLLGTQPVHGRVLPLRAVPRQQELAKRADSAHGFWVHNGVALHATLYSCSNKHGTFHLTARRSPSQSRAPPGYLNSVVLKSESPDASAAPLGSTSL